jgi:uncharacterized protein
MSQTALYIVAGIALCFANTTAWVATWFGLPGTWVMVALTALACHFFPEIGSLGLSWLSVGVLGGLAVLGEVWETGASAMLAKNAGGSRRGAAFSMLGAIAGSIAGAFLGVPIPVFGSMIGAVAGAAGGAFAGAWIGEGQLGRSVVDRMAIGKAAASGRVLGTIGKLVVGLAMVVVATAAFFF